MLDIVAEPEKVSFESGFEGCECWCVADCLREVVPDGRGLVCEGPLAIGFSACDLDRWDDKKFFLSRAEGA